MIHLSILRNNVCRSESRNHSNKRRRCNYWQFRPIAAYDSAGLDVCLENNDRGGRNATAGEQTCHCLPHALFKAALLLLRGKCTTYVNFCSVKPWKKKALTSDSDKKHKALILTMWRWKRSTRSWAVKRQWHGSTWTVMLAPCQPPATLTTNTLYNICGRQWPVNQRASPMNSVINVRVDRKFG